MNYCNLKFGPLCKLIHTNYEKLISSSDISAQFKKHDMEKIAFGSFDRLFNMLGSGTLFLVIISKVI